MLSRPMNWWHKLGRSNRIAVGVAMFGAVVTISAAVISPLASWILPPRDQSNPLINTTPTYDSKFIADVTYPDDSTVTPNQVIIKEWKIKNTGSRPWKGFSIANQKNQSYGFEAAQSTYPIPEVQPGHQVTLEVALKVVANSGDAYSLWKIVDSNGALVFPNRQGIWCKVIVQGQ